MTDFAIRPFQTLDLAVRSIYLPELKRLAIVYPMAVVAGIVLFLVHATTGIEFLSKAVPVAAIEKPASPTEYPQQEGLPEPTSPILEGTTSDIVADLIGSQPTAYARVGVAITMPIPALDERLPWMVDVANTTTQPLPFWFGYSLPKQRVHIGRDLVIELSPSAIVGGIQGISPGHSLALTT